MRFPSVIVLLAFAGMVASGFGPSRAAADEQFPYTAYANSEDVYIRSGPGKNYYPTEKLGKGTPMEVYRNDPGGWYAIRPPQGSFSWVPADALKPTGDHLATVQRDHTLCFVGTRFSNAHDVHQVRLDKGERVQILDIKQIGEGDQAQSWCQIAPPSGEFRWVFGKFVDRDLPEGISRPRDEEHAARPKDAFDERDDATALRDKHSDWVAKGGETSSKSDTLASGDSSWHSSSERRSGSATDKPGATAPDPFQAELDAIDLQVSKIASDDPATWEFTSQRRRAEAELDRANTALERGRVRLILNRIARFEDVKRRTDLINQPGAPSSIASYIPSPTANDPGRFDSVGKLTPVVSQRPNAPQYALVDGSNQVVSFVTAGPGVNLQQYVGKEVGVSGERGYIPDLQKPHVTAQRINVMDGTTLR
jgi:hypothetical protein